jgi:xanthine/CO dehydrogenase XdhC/CoxF family maturation factor
MRAIGNDINSELPEEIAVNIKEELIQVMGESFPMREIYLKKSGNL